MTRKIGIVDPMDDFSSFGVHVIPGVNDKFGALITEDTKRIFDYEEVKPVDAKDGFRGYVPWGEDNEQPLQILEKIRDDEVMSSNMWFNITTGYGRGFKVTNPDGSPVTDEAIRKFFRRNNMTKLWLEQFTDIKHFYFSVMVIILDAEGKQIVKIRHKEAVNCRFETCDPETGNIEHVFYANWKDKPKDDEIEVQGSMQCLYYIKNALINALACGDDEVRVVQSPTGGGFGGKEDYPSMMACHFTVA